jgi:flavin reductase (DIM6/NTAB) family NADH-FMN oxidoreductase RutF
MHDTSVIPASNIVSDAFRCSHLVFAATTYNAGVFVTMENLLHDIAAHNLQNRKVAIIENGSWAPMSGKAMREILSGLKKIEYIGEGVTLKSALAAGQDAELEALAEALAADILPPPVEAPAPAAAPAAPTVFSPEVVDTKAFNKFSYGVEVLTTRVDGKDYGCIINTAGQVAAGDVKKITISVIKKNNTCDMVMKAGKFNISILTEDAPYSVFQHFGFQSGRDVDKFADAPYDERMSNGIRYFPLYTNAVLSCEVIEHYDLETQMLYIANVVEAKVLSNAPSCTYGYYHAHIKPKKNPAPEQKEAWVCKVCGYVYEGAEMPDDFTCPLCKHGKEDFEHVVPDATPKQKGYVCKICGHFEPCEGELPADYTCPLCKHTREDFEPAEQ